MQLGTYLPVGKKLDHYHSAYLYAVHKYVCSFIPKVDNTLGKIDLLRSGSKFLKLVLKI